MKKEVFDNQFTISGRSPWWHKGALRTQTNKRKRRDCPKTLEFNPKITSPMTLQDFVKSS
jgi:hypothetical protein